MNGDVNQHSAFLTLPIEILINILSYLDEKDLYILQEVCLRLRRLVNNEELWKNLFISQIHTNYFPSFAYTPKYSVEYVERRHGLRQWRHNRAIKTKYVIAPSPRFQIQIESLVFDYPRCACYNDGTITLIQLHQKRRKDRLLYIPCTTPQGCSTMHFNINSAVFGRSDGRVYGKLLNNKSYLTPVTEFNARHTHAVSAIAAYSSQSFSEDWYVSGSTNGELMWWSEAKLVKGMRISSKPIQRLALYKNWTIALNEDKIYVISAMDQVYPLDLPKVRKGDGCQVPLNVEFFRIDFGAKLLILADLNYLFVIDFDPESYFGHTRSLQIQESISNLVVDEATCRKERNPDLAGGDGCFIAILTANNSIKVINIRSPGNILGINVHLHFDKEVHTCQITNLVVACALTGKLQIFDAASGDLLKSVQNTDKHPQFLGLSQGRMVIASRNVIQYLQYIPAERVYRKRTHSSNRGQNIKWEKEVNLGMDIYNEEEQIRYETAERNRKLLEDYGGGDMSEEELHLRIALMESESAAEQNSHGRQEAIGETDRELDRALEESRLQHEREQLLNGSTYEGGNNPMDPLEQPSAAERRSRPRNRTRNDAPENITNDDANNEINNPVQQRQQQTDDEEALQLAIALSLSEMS